MPRELCSQTRSLRIEVKVQEWTVAQNEHVAPEKGGIRKETIALIKEEAAEALMSGGAGRTQEDPGQGATVFLWRRDERKLQSPWTASATSETWLGPVTHAATLGFTPTCGFLCY